MKLRRLKHRLFRRKVSAASSRKMSRMQESIWWIVAKRAPTRDGEPQMPWFSRLISHRLGGAL